MKRYRVFRNGKETHSWTDDFAGADFYEESMGPLGTFTVTVEDLTAEIAAKQARIDNLKAKLTEFRNFDIANATTAQLKTFLEKQRAVLDKVIVLLAKSLEGAE